VELTDSFIIIKLTLELNEKSMIRKSLNLILIIVIVSTYGCVKDTYDMSKLSKEAHLSPTLAISAVKGDVSFKDLVKESDTVIFDPDNFVRIVFKKDSVVNLKMADFYDLNNMVSFSQSYTIGELSLSPFSGTIGLTLDQISQKFSTVLRNQFVALNDGAPHPFPPFPSTNLNETTFTAFANFQNAVFASGFLDISITNNLPAPLNSISVNLFNTAGHTAIGGTLTIPATLQGQTNSASIDLTGKTLTNSIIAAIVLSGSPGNATPVVINLANSNIKITIQGRNLKVKSGRVILPAQTISTLDNKDTISFDPGPNIEIEKLRITTGNVSYHMRSTSSLGASLNITIPSALRSGTAVNEVINVGPSTQFDGIISFNNTIVDLNTDVTQPYNRVPILYGISVSSNSTMVTFNSTDMVQFDMKLQNPVFDYVKGYFGQQTESINPDTLDLGIKDLLKNITGTFLVSSPSIRFNYSNSFGIPIEIDLKAAGKKGSNTVNLDLLPFLIAYPVYPASRNADSFLDINKNNSKLPQLISMPPEEISFSGSAKMNPAGDPAHLRNNYVFGDSRFLGSVEVEVPLEFRINNLQFSDTVDNFMKDTNSDSPIKPENFEFLRFNIYAKNGFPLGVTLKMSLYDSVNNIIRSTIDATDLIKAAPVDASGRSNGTTETTTTIEMTGTFFNNVNKSDKIIFRFGLNTSENGSKDVKIYSDYRIDFKAALVVKPDIQF
jgi:hypothetical protein